MRIRSGFPTTSRSRNPGVWLRGARRYAAPPRRAPPVPRSPSTSIARAPVGHDDFAGPLALCQPSHGHAEEPIDIKRSTRRDRNAPLQDLGHRVFGTWAFNMAGFDPSDGPTTVRDQHRLPAPNLAQQSAESVLRFAHTGPFHLAIMAMRVLPVKPTACPQCYHIPHSPSAVARGGSRSRVQQLQRCLRKRGFPSAAWGRAVHLGRGRPGGRGTLRDAGTPGAHGVHAPGDVSRYRRVGS